ncbi:MAG: hypothetical protein IPM35_41070 [Myxococcales bacterium]|nr:hypothetical protein [Myxococcales bacterium]
MARAGATSGALRKAGFARSVFPAVRAGDFPVASRFAFTGCWRFATRFTGGFAFATRFTSGFAFATRFTGGFAFATRFTGGFAFATRFTGGFAFATRFTGGFAFATRFTGGFAFATRFTGGFAFATRFTGGFAFATRFTGGFAFATRFTGGFAFATRFTGGFAFATRFIGGFAFATRFAFAGCFAFAVAGRLAVAGFFLARADETFSVRRRALVGFPTEREPRFFDLTASFLLASPRKAADHPVPSLISEVNRKSLCIREPRTSAQLNARIHRFPSDPKTVTLGGPCCVEWSCVVCSRRGS